MCASALGAVFAFLALVVAWRDARSVFRRDASSQQEALQRASDDIGATGALVRLVGFLVIELALFAVAREAFDTEDAPAAIFGKLSMDSNLAQILVASVIGGLSAWDLRDFQSRRRLSELASFAPGRRAGKRARRADVVDVEDQT